MRKYTTIINPLFGRKILTSFSEFNIPQLLNAHKLYNQNKFNQAYENYERVDNMLQSAKMINSP